MSQIKAKEDEDRMPPSLKWHRFHDHQTQNPFKSYLTRTIVSDNEFIDDCNQSMDSLLVFAGLFSAVTTALIVESYKDLKPEPMARTEQVLDAILTRMTNPNTTYHVDIQSFKARRSTLFTNSLLFLSLFFSLIAALGALLIKQWTRKIFMGLNEIRSTRRRAREHFKRVEGLKRWHMSWYISWIPMLLHLALVLFAIGLISWLQSLSWQLFVTLICISAFAVAGYFVFAIIPAFSPDAPFRWPVSGVFRYLRRFAPSHPPRTILPVTTELPLVESQGKELRVTFTTPLGNIHELNDDFRDAVPDALDGRILVDTLMRADTPAEVEGVVETWRKELAASTMSADISDTDKLILLEKMSMCALSCRIYEGDKFEIPEGSGMERATNLVRFLEHFLQLTTLSDSRFLPPLAIISSHIQYLLKRAISKSSMPEICLHGNTLALISLATGELGHLALADQVVMGIRDAGPAARHWTQRGFKTPPPQYRYRDAQFDRYQQLTTPYFYHLTLLIIRASSNNPLDPISLRELQEDSRLAIFCGAHNEFIDEEKNVWTLLSGFLRREWDRQQAAAPSVRTWIRTMMRATGWCPYEEDDGSVSVIKVTEAWERDERKKNALASQK
ncbi:hypothetical protein FRC17_000320 [Serendipita sp. 399]|nr:hypothetical protein FRC17_000320 [Serendipita sp. 399]